MPTPTHRSRELDHADLMDGWLQVVNARHHALAEDVHPDHAGYGFDLVLLDMDGTITRGLSSWVLLHDHFGVTNESNWERFRDGEITDHAFMESDIALWRTGREVHVDEIERVLAERTRYMDHVREFVDALHARGVATCIVSGGLDITARRVCEDTGIDMFVANGLRLTATGHLAGDGLSFVSLKDKGRVTREILARLGVRKARAASVGNSIFDAGMFRESRLGIAFSPEDDGVRDAADVVVEGQDMLDVLAVLDEHAWASKTE